MFPILSAIPEFGNRRRNHDDRRDIILVRHTREPGDVNEIEIRFKNTGGIKVNKTVSSPGEITIYRRRVM